MTLRNGSWIHRPSDDAFYDHSHEYPNSTVCDGPNKSTLRKPLYNRPWFVILQLLVIAAAIVCCMSEAGCFDQ